MRLSPGARLGPYEISSSLGAGGMGEVYKATDTRLRRVVAIKVIREGQLEEPQRVRRFESEARAAAVLDHPNILTVHDVGVHDGAPYIVSELLEGETLAALLEGGALPVRKAIDLALQVAHGLTAAHDKGILHRDLKPSNLWLTRDGRVKILDFGLAKLTEPEPGTAVEVTRTTSTSPGTVMGTIGYMSPEQVRGEPLDARADIFAFGAVLYEMLSGRHAFEGATAADVMSAVMRQDPAELSSSGGTVTPVLERIVRRCLEKKPEQRFRSVHDLAFALEAVAGGSSTPESNVSAPSPARPASSRLVLVALAALTLGAAGAWVLRGLGSIGDPSIGQRVTRFQLSFPEGTGFADSYPSVAISPDGTTIALAAQRSGGHELYLRRLNGSEWTRLPGTEGATNPFFSPKGDWLGFFSPGKLKRVSVAGGTPQVICDVKSVRAGLPQGTWTDDGQILFSSWPDQGLWRVQAGGGAPQRLKGTEAASERPLWYRRPNILPERRDILFGTWTAGKAQVEVLSLNTNRRRTLIAEGCDPSYARTGHLVFGWDNQVLAAPFDVQALEVRGVPVPLVEGVRMHYGRALSADYALSENGTLVFSPGHKAAIRLLWVDRSGRTTPLPLPSRGYVFPAISPVQDRVAVTIAEGPSRDVWIGDLSRGTLSRLTTDGDAVFSLWTPDAKHVLFTSSKAGQYNVFRKRADGGGDVERVTESRNPQRATSVSPDGRFVLLNDLDPVSLLDVWLQRLDGDRKAVPLLKTAANEQFGAFSPDGTWVTYDSDESGRFEVYIQPYPGPGERKQISTEGGRGAVWNPNGRELFYTVGNQLMSVSFEAGARIRIGKPRLLFRVWLPTETLEGRPTYHVSADGERFLFQESAETKSEEPRLRVVLNWFDELQRRVPAQ